jgi:cytochrome c oxidase accessory protein FixG
MQRTFEETLLKPKDRVLSTMNGDGKRRWLWPRLSKGTLWQRRRWFAYFLIALFTVTPYLSMNGKPVILIDVVNRKFHILGQTFLPSDTLLMALLMLSVFLAIFAFTAIFGRVFCGWACPQTVWLEYVYRPIERVCLGTAGRGGKPAQRAPVWRYVAMYAIFLLVSIHLAHTALSYFVGVSQLHHWIWQSTPWQHPAAFIVVAIVTAWMMWDFAYWREQMCIIGCPYGRFQSALLDRQSLIVSYDYRRGEPRRGVGGSETKARAVSLKVVPAADRRPPAADPVGDCISCTMCVQVCPTGIDIRDGLQSECINCTQCIDACDAVMDKIGKPRGLIGYSSQVAREGAPKKLLRPRVVIYPTLLTIVLTAFFVVLFTKPKMDMVVLRAPGTTFESVDNRHIINRFKIDLTNRSSGPQTYAFAASEGMTIDVDGGPVELDPIETKSVQVRVVAMADTFRHGRSHVTLTATDSSGHTRSKTIELRGPYGY